MEFMRQQVEAQNKAAKGDVPATSSWIPETEDSMRDKFARTQAVLGGHIPAVKMPIELRDMMAWAEQMKTEHGMN